MKEYKNKTFIKVYSYDVYIPQLGIGEGYAYCTLPNSILKPFDFIVFDIWESLTDKTAIQYKNGVLGFLGNKVETINVPKKKFISRKNEYPKLLFKIDKHNRKFIDIRNLNFINKGISDDDIKNRCPNSYIV